MNNQKLMYVYIGLLVVMNSLYFALEIYKHTIRNEWMNEVRTETAAFIELSSLGVWTSAIEIMVSLLFLVVVIWIIKKQRNDFMKFTSINLVLFAVFSASGVLIASIFGMAVGNLLQQIAGPFVIILFLMAYQGMTMVLTRRHKLQ